MKNKLNLPNKIHFIGIGGAGMNPLAGICLKENICVTGSDSTPNKNQNELRALGADIWTPHSAEELAKHELPDICVYSTAIPSDNPEVIYLKEKGVQFWHRSDLLEQIANNFEKQIVIAGTHGKTTTTAMLVWILEKAGLKPCWVLGGILKGLGSYGWSEQREIFVFEGDESDQSFLKSKPFIGLVTSLEPDHLENYNNSFEEQIKKFSEFASKCKNLVLNLNCRNVYKHLNEYSQPDLRFINSEHENKSIKWRFTKDKHIYFEQYLFWENFQPEKLFGKVNSGNALSAVIATYKVLNLEILRSLSNKCSSNWPIAGSFPIPLKSFLQDFPGIYRRFEIIGTTKNNITVIDDYAHHPTEVKAAIQAGHEFLKQKNNNGKLIVCFQPHLPTRLRDLWREFSECFEEADELILNDLYIARGQPIEGIDSRNLFKEIKHFSKTYISGKPENMIENILQKAKDNDLILLLGAGDITYIREKLFEALTQF